MGILWGNVGVSYDIYSDIVWNEKIKVVRTANQTLANDAALTGTAVLFPTGSANEEIGAGGSMHSMSTNTSRLTAVTAGAHIVQGCVNFAPSATNSRAVFVDKTAFTGGAVTRQFNKAKSGLTGLYVTIDFAFDLQLAAGDYVQMLAAQDSGGNLDAVAGYTRFSLRRV
jgi:hypothetical protein